MADSQVRENSVKRCLTSPSDGVHNDGLDNVNSDLILYADDVLGNRYVVKEVIGVGEYGQVAKCLVSETGAFVAVKVIRNLTAHYNQAFIEIPILTTLNEERDPEDKHHIVRMTDHFHHKKHLCICFELLGENLYEILMLNEFKGLRLQTIREFSRQMLEALKLLKTSGIIHTDLKPENILLSDSGNPPQFKLIDFGSACFEGQSIYTYAQSRYYRSPEVLLGYKYGTAIDMWSFGCIVAELFLGLPLFPASSEFDLMRRMIEVLGEQPPDSMLIEAKKTSQFFDRNDGDRHVVLPLEEGAAAERRGEIEILIVDHGNSDDMTDEEMEDRLALADFLRGILEYDPDNRLVPEEALNHPFITGEPLTPRSEEDGDDGGSETTEDYDPANYGIFGNYRYGMVLWAVYYLQGFWLHEEIVEVVSGSYRARWITVVWSPIVGVGWTYTPEMLPLGDPQDDGNTDGATSYGMGADGRA